MLSLLSACAAQGPETPQLASEVDEILNRPAAKEDYVETRRCLSMHEYDSVEIVDEQRLVFRDRSRDKVWLNEMRSRCPGLHRNDTLMFEVRASSLCNLDRVEVVDRLFFWRRSGPVCTLGNFERISGDTADLLMQALR